MIKIFLILSLLLLSLKADDDILLESDFLQSLDEVSQIATKTKLNIDDSPSFITVLHSQKLQKLGITNVFEALGLVPGVQLKKEISGTPVVVFRGAIQRGEVKLMVDGITINNTYRDSIHHYLDFPIEMIKRIEVIRGSGSVLYGSNAISGVINIITNSSQKDSKNTIFVSAGSYDSKKVGTLLSTNIDDFKISLDAYLQDSDKTILVTPNQSRQIGNSDRHLKDYSTSINISNKHFSFLGRVKKSDMGNAYGFFNSLDTNLDKYNQENTSYFTQLSYKNKLDKNNNITLLGGYIKYAQEVETAHPMVPTIQSVYKEKAYFTELNFMTTSIANNELLIGAEFKSTKTLESKLSAGKPYVSDPTFSRKTASLYLSNKYSLSSEIDISGGLRYDNYSDSGNHFSPNLGAVYRLNENIKLKAIYSHTFHVPTWVDLTSYKNLEAEKSDAFEVGAVFKQNLRNTLRLNFYVTKIKDMIAENKTNNYYNQDYRKDFFGAELEYTYLPTNHLELNFLASYAEAKDENEETLSCIADILMSTSLIYELASGVTFGSLIKYTSSSGRSATDTRGNMPSSLIFDQTISYTYRNFTTSLVFKDLFDANTYYALPQNPYSTDFDDGGRSFMLNAALEF